MHHLAKIIKTTPEEIALELERKPACAGCEHQNTCALHTARQETFTLPNDHSQNYQPGQMVELEINASTGWLALFFAYILPLLVVLSTLLLIHLFTKNDEKSAIFSLFSLILYYFLLFLLKNRFKSKITITTRPWDKPKI